MKFDITPYNYEAYYLDFLEGNLQGEALQAFLAFKHTHPELFDNVDDEADIVNNTVSPEPQVSYPTNHLKINEKIEDWLIAYSEGVISEKEQQQLGQELKRHPFLQRDLQLYQAVKLQAVPILYPNTEKLKKHPVLVPVWLKYAAAIVVLAGLFRLFSGKFLTTPAYSPNAYHLAITPAELPDMSFMSGDALPEKKAEKSIVPSQKNNKPSRTKQLYIDKLPLRRHSDVTTSLPETVMQYRVQNANYKNTAGQYRAGTVEHFTSLPQFFTFMFHKQVLKQPQKQFNWHSLTAAVNRFTPVEVYLKNSDNSTVFALTGKRFLFSFKKNK